ncbi:MAG TPA: dienelactone hydrolase family protein [Hypericibacter adhaerens]|jgi:carboxymethylenebutenolidase|uniref:Carboxymethylenebutenolidase n=1 Tax=Hypericibacter adhaerens TaxID=2602016 RepID=A0A5J6MWE9_9PROT|nr:dienelactone hydrolase family protein [Hypericibacter adhaerens]QEX21948.1 carboxymethylenebutenolidase [Hypericibacter adhaerens]HWA45195.1 dienelactone hydrolase family protein [Hypericibacter adhaerens]
MGSVTELKAADGFKLAAYRAAPAGASKGGLVVIQEIFGVNHHIRSVADRFAALGYTALAPALFDRAERGIDIGYDEASVQRGIKLRAAIKLEDTLLDVAAAVGALKGAGKIAVVGYCWGGSLAFLSATRLPGLACTVGYYGGMIAAHAQEKPKVPVLLHFGEHDHGIPMTDVEKVRAARPEVQIFTYNAGHGFSCDERASFDKASHEQALARTLDFFGKHLKP